MMEVNYLNSKTCIVKNQGSMFPVMLMVKKIYLTDMSQLIHNLIIVIAIFQRNNNRSNAKLIDHLQKIHLPLLLSAGLTIQIFMQHK